MSGAPWFWSGREDHNGYSYADELCDADGRQIATGWEGGMELRTECMDLLAAAPDLLDVVARFVEVVDDFGIAQLDSDRTLIAAARAALEKARPAP